VWTIAPCGRIHGYLAVDLVPRHVAGEARLAPAQLVGVEHRSEQVAGFTERPLERLASCRGGVTRAVHVEVRPVVAVHLDPAGVELAIQADGVCAELREGADPPGERCLPGAPGEPEQKPGDRRVGLRAQLQRAAAVTQAAQRFADDAGRRQWRRESRADLAGVAARGAAADPVTFEHDHVDARGAEIVRDAQPDDSAADDGDVIDVADVVARARHLSRRRTPRGTGRLRGAGIRPFP
jgi:hypothetical protein